MSGFLVVIFALKTRFLKHTIISAAILLFNITFFTKNCLKIKIFKSSDMLKFDKAAAATCYKPPVIFAVSQQPCFQFNFLLYSVFCALTCCHLALKCYKMALSQGKKCNMLRSRAEQSGGTLAVKVHVSFNFLLLFLIKC